jgi:hypothetical protein
MNAKEKYLNGLHLFNRRLIANGKRISIGASGIASRPSFSFGTPDSMSFRKLIDSVANAIFQFKSKISSKNLLFHKLIKKEVLL